MSTIAPRAWAQVSLTTINSPYAQDFNTLASSGTSSMLPAGFVFIETGTANNTTYTAGTGSATTGDTYSFGAAGNTDRAFGGLQSGSLVPTIGASFVNNTGTPITSLSITYTGEQWKLGATGRAVPDRLDFQYSTNATSLSTGTYTDVDALDFTAPITTGTVAALDGNASANRATLTNTITGLSIAPGATFWIRYNDFNATGSDDGLAIDDFSLTPIAVVCPAITASFNGTTTICTGSSTNLTATITGGTGPYSLTYSDGTNTTVIGGYTSGANIPVSPTTNTTYTIIAATDANACPATVSGMGATVTVNQNPTASMAGASQTITTGNAATLAANAPTVGAGTWSVASGPSLAASQFNSTTNPAAVFTPAGGVGNYVLTWTISNAPCTASASSLTITVNAAAPVCGNLNVPGDFSTIQAAVNAACPGVTINVAPGTYTEQVVITKNLTIAGGGAGSTIIKAPATLAAGGPDEGAPFIKRNIVEIKGTSVVTMSGLTIDGTVTGQDGCGTDAFGLYVYDNSGLNLANAAITNIRLTDPSLFGCQVGFAVGVGLTGSPGSATLTNVTVNGYQKGGILVRGTGSTLVAQAVNVTGIGPTTVTGQNGIQVSSGASASITSSTIANNNYTPPAGDNTTASGIIAFDAGTVTITGSLFTGNDVGVDASGTGTTNINNNTFTNNEYASIYVTAPAVVNSSGNTFDKQVTNNNKPGTIYSGIQIAVDDATAGDVLTAAAGTYNELVVIPKSLTINGVGAASNVTFTGTVPGSALASLFTVAAANVTIQNLGFTVDLSKVHSAIHTTGNDRSNLRVIGNTITPTGTPGLPYSRRNAIAINPNISGIPGYTLDNDGFAGATVQSNTVAAGTNGLTNTFRAAVQIDLCGGTVGGATGNLGNTLTAINHDVISAFTNQGDLTIQNNICGGGGIQLGDPNPGAGTITIANNTLDGAFVQPTSGALGTGALMRIRNNGISGVKPLFIQNNTFQNHRWGISAENNGGISITGNTFTPNAAATDFRHISINSKTIASNSASLTDAQMQTLSGTLTGNTFNESSTSGTGTAIAFLNHRTAGAKFGTFTLGSGGNENTFAANIGTFIRLDNSTGTSTGFMSPFNDYAGIPATDMGPWTQDYTIRANRFDVGSGPQLPGTMNAGQRATLETKLFHKPDDASVGQLLYFDPVRNLTQNIGYQTIGAAITAANANDVIQLDEFTFNERVIIDKPLSLTGVSKTMSIIDGTGLSGTGSGIAIASGVTNVTIKNLTVQKFVGSNPNSSAGIYAAQSNSNLLVDNVQSLSNVGGSGFYANGPVQNVTVTNSTVSGHTNVAGAARGIVVWNGFKQNITISNNTVSDNNCCGIELQDGTASGVTITGNTLTNNGDNGIGVVGLKAGAGQNVIANNILNTNGRFGIEIKNPDGTGMTSGDGSIVVENNTVSFTASPTMNNRDHAGISVYRRAFLPNNTEGYADVPKGVVIRNNTVSGYQHQNQVSAPTESEGFGIVIEGTNHTVSGNTLTNNNIGV
ncbi:MAG: right-handed parallel beta-helix repeat-containing protein, partial [Bacteroidetes bacterium]|nr:right-handed parallel beta-helix repeat-containing protein [Fibrella sp.]